VLRMGTSRGDTTSFDVATCCQCIDCFSHVPIYLLSLPLSHLACSLPYYAFETILKNLQNKLSLYIIRMNFHYFRQLGRIFRNKIFVPIHFHYLFPFNHSLTTLPFLSFFSLSCTSFLIF